jgi:hypothetical protein
VAIGAVFMWKLREHAGARAFLGAAVGATAIWSAILLDRTPDWTPWLHDVVLILGGLAALALLFPIANRRVAVLVAGTAIVIGLAAPAAYTVSTVRQSHNGAIPSSGPVGVGGGFGPGGAAGGLPGGVAGGLPGGGGQGGGQGGAQARGGIGGLLGGTAVNAKVAQFLQAGKAGHRWVAAAVGANNAASYQLASGEAVMAIGGFNGSDPAPTLQQFERYVAQGKIHYFIAGGGLGGLGGLGGPGGLGGLGGLGGPGGPGGPGGGSGNGTAISSWVSSNFASVTVGGVTLYDLTQPLAGSSTSGSGA